MSSSVRLLLALVLLVASVAATVGLGHEARSRNAGGGSRSNAATADNVDKANDDDDDHAAADEDHELELGGARRRGSDSHKAKLAGGALLVVISGVVRVGCRHHLQFIHRCGHPPHTVDVVGWS
jgi:hypothetical protein